MHITVPLESLPRAGSDGGSRQLLRPGTTIEGLVRREDGKLVLRLGRLRLPLASRLPLQEGDRLRVQVTMAKGEARLEILGRQPASPKGDVNLARQLLPRQGDMAEPFRVALGATDPDIEGLPPTVRRLLDSLLQRLPEPRHLFRPEGLRHALRDSGVFYEWLLAAAPHSAAKINTSDLKAALLRLAARLSEAPSRGTNASEPVTPVTRGLDSLGEAVEGALSRLRLLQLQNARGDGGLDLAFELPVRDGQDMDRVDLRLREDGSRRGREDDTAAPLEVTARFHFDSEEALVARLILVGDTVHVTWWAASEPLRRQVRAALPALSGRLEAVGLEIGSLACRESAPPTPAPWPERVEGGLIDDSA